MLRRSDFEWIILRRRACAIKRRGRGGIVRSSSAQAEWLPGLRYGRNAQISPIFIDPDIPDMSQTKLFEPFKLGPITLPNRFVMAPLTRNRAVPPGMVPSPLATDYYGQRASAGLLITEASQVSQQGQGYQDTPGIYSKEQVAGWRKVTDGVHESGGRIFIQLWHVGRISQTRCSLAAASRSRRPRSAPRPRPSSTAPSPTSPSRARWSWRKFPGSSRTSSAAPRTRWTPASTASRSTAPTAICSTSSPRTAPTSAPMPTAARSRTAHD